MNSGSEWEKLSPMKTLCSMPSSPDVSADINDMEKQMKNAFANKPVLGAAVALAALTLSQQATAVVVTPGNTVALSGTTAIAQPDLVGAVIYEQLIPFQISDGLGNVIIQGNLQDRVMQSANTGELIFAPRLLDMTAPSGDAWISGYDLNGYNGWLTDVDYRTDSLGDEGPNQVSRSADGDQLDFRIFAGVLTPPEESYFTSVHSDAFNYDLSGMITLYAQNDFGAQYYTTEIGAIAAPSPVPVPGAAWLFGSGLAGLIGVMRRREQRGR